MTSVLITGFEPFTTGKGLVLDRNPTGEIARAVGSTVDACTGRVLPVSFKDTRAQLEALLEELAPTYWVGMGFAPHRTTLDLEAIALTVEHAVHGDNDGECPTSVPLGRRPVAYAVPWTRTGSARAGRRVWAHAFTRNLSLQPIPPPRSTREQSPGFRKAPSSSCPAHGFLRLTRALESLVRETGKHPTVS